LTCQIGLSGALYTVPVDPDATNYEVAYKEISSAKRSLDGSLQTSWTAIKRVWKVSWPGLTQDQVVALIAELNRQAYLIWVPPGSTEQYTVKVNDRNWRSMPDSSDYRIVTAELEEV